MVLDVEEHTVASVPLRRLEGAGAVMTEKPRPSPTFLRMKRFTISAGSLLFAVYGAVQLGRDAFSKTVDFSYEQIVFFAALAVIGAALAVLFRPDMPTSPVSQPASDRASLQDSPNDSEARLPLTSQRLPITEPTGTISAASPARFQAALPRRVRSFTGRVRELKWIQDQLSAGGEDGEGILVISGISGGRQTQLCRGVLGAIWEKDYTPSWWIDAESGARSY